MVVIGIVITKDSVDDVGDSVGLVGAKIHITVSQAGVPIQVGFRLLSDAAGPVNA